MLACRLCRVPINAAEGCEVCDPVRRNLVLVGENEQDKPSLSGTASLGVELLNQQLRGVQKDLKDNPRSPTAEGRLLKLANTAAKLLETSRKLIHDGVSAVDMMSPAEQLELFLGWYMNLPPGYRAGVMAKFTEHETELAKPIGEQPRDDN